MPDTRDRLEPVAARRLLRMRDLESEVLLAFDFGARRIGVASANTHTATATPLGTLSNGAQPPWAQLDRLIAQWRPARLLVGLPGDEAQTDIGAAATSFADALASRYALAVDLVDETLTSRAARSELIMARKDGLMKRRIKRQDLDSLAACLIAEQWLREQ